MPSWLLGGVAIHKQDMEMDDNNSDRVLGQPHARTGRKSNPATTPDSHERYANSGKPTVAEVPRSDSPPLRASKGSLVEGPLSGAYIHTQFGATATPKSTENKYGTVHLPQPSTQHTYASEGDGCSPSSTSPQLPVHEPWNQNPQPRSQVQPVKNSASGRPEVYPPTHSSPDQAHTQLTHVPTHTPPPSQDIHGGGVLMMWGQKEKQNSADEGIETSCDLPSPVSPGGQLPRAGMIKNVIRRQPKKV